MAINKYAKVNCLADGGHHYLELVSCPLKIYIIYLRNYGIRKIPLYYARQNQS